jgi:hypothetical protein
MCGFRGDVRPLPPKIRKAYVIQRQLSSSTNNFFMNGWLGTCSKIFLHIANTRWLGSSVIVFFPEFNIRLYDKNSESDYFFFPPPKSEYFSSNIGNQNIFLEKKHSWTTDSIPYMNQRTYPTNIVMLYWIN